jgi:hypothetical protein
VVHEALPAELAHVAVEIVEAEDVRSETTDGRDQDAAVVERG